MQVNSHQEIKLFYRAREFFFSGERTKMDNPF